MPEVPRARRWIDVRGDEWRIVVGAFVCFFALLCGYYMVRPLRETMAVAIGTRYGHWLFTGTFFSTMVATSLFGWVATIFPRKVFVSLVFWVFIGSLLIFAQIFRLVGIQVIPAAAFFVWISVANYFLISVFWSVMADVFDELQGRRLFAWIAAGGTLGAITGPLITSFGVVHLGQSGILAAAAALLIVVPVGLFRILSQHADNTSASPTDTSIAVDVPSSRTANNDVPLGGSPWSGVRETLTSSFLLQIGLYTLLAGVVGSTIYLMQNVAVEQSGLNLIQRTQFFARADSATNVLTLILELFVTGWLLKHWGVGPSLLVLPLIALIGFPIQASFPSLLSIAVLQVTRRAAEYAVAKPGREVLFTGVPRDQKYKAKNFIDTVLARAGDMISSWTQAGIRSSGMSHGLTTLLAAGVTLLFGLVGWRLMRQHSRTNEAAALGSEE